MRYLYTHTVLYPRCYLVASTSRYGRFVDINPRHSVVCRSFRSIFLNYSKNIKGIFSAINREKFKISLGSWIFVTRFIYNSVITPGASQMDGTFFSTICLRNFQALAFFKKINSGLSRFLHFNWLRRIMYWEIMFEDNWRLRTIMYGDILVQVQVLVLV